MIDTDLHRLVFGINQAVGEQVTDNGKAALKRFADERAESEISARALFNLASILHGENDLTEAHKTATRGMQAFPNSYGGKQCFTLLQQIEGKSVGITTERVWNEP